MLVTTAVIKYIVVTLKQMFLVPNIIINGVYIYIYIYIYISLTKEIWLGTI